MPKIVVQWNGRYMCANEIIQKKSVSTILDACVYYYMQEKIICGPRFYYFFSFKFHNCYTPWKKMFWLQCRNDIDLEGFFFVRMESSDKQKCGERFWMFWILDACLEFWISLTFQEWTPPVTKKYPPFYLISREE